MYQQSDSAAGVRFLAAVREGRGVKPSARAAGVGKATGYGWLRESFLAFRESGCSIEDAQVKLGRCSRAPSCPNEVVSSSIRRFDSRHPLYYKDPCQRVSSVALGLCHLMVSHVLSACCSQRILLAGWGKHEVASFFGTQFPGDAASGVGHQIFDADGRVPNPAAPVLRGRGDSVAVWSPRNAFHFLAVDADDDDLSA